MIETLEKTGILNTVKMSYEFTPLPKGYDLRWESGPKVNSLENIHYMPAGGNKVIPQERLQWRREAKVGSLDRQHMELTRPRSLSGGADGKKVKLLQYRTEYYKGFRNLEYDQYGRPYVKIQSEKVSGQPKVGSLDNKDHVPGGGDVSIVNQRVDWCASPKVGSLLNAHHKPLGGNKQIASEKLDFRQRASPRVASLENKGYVPGGGDVEIINQNLNWDAQPKVDSLSNVSHTPRAPTKKIVHDPTKWQAAPKVGSLENKDYCPGGGQVAIVDTKLNWDTGARINSLENAQHKPGGGQVRIATMPTKWEASPRVCSLENAHYKPSGGNVQIVNQCLKWDASPKVGSLEMASYKPGGGDVPIFHDTPRWNTTSKVGSWENATYRPRGGNKTISPNPTPDFRRTASPRVGSMDNTKFKPGHLHGPLKMNWDKDEVMWPQYEFGRTSRVSGTFSRSSAQTVP